MTESNDRLPDPVAGSALGDDSRTPHGSPCSRRMQSVLHKGIWEAPPKECAKSFHPSETWVLGNDDVDIAREQFVLDGEGYDDTSFTRV